MNITLKRWLTIIIYGCLSAFFLKAFVQVEWVQKFVIWCGDTFALFGVYPQKGLLFVLGFLLYQLLLKMNIYSKKSSIKIWIVYPPITFIILPFVAVALILFFDEFQFKNISWNHGFNLISLVAFIAGKSIYDFHSLSEKKDLKINDSQDKKSESRASITTKSTYEEYKKWFEDDSPVSNIKLLSVDLRPYAERIKNHIIKQSKDDKSVHLSICGGFGSGKSSIIKCVTNELDSSFIHSNIDTWGTDIKSVNAFVLAKVVDDVADYVDMSAFKSLPSQYIEALKLGNNTSKLLAIFSTVSSNPEKGLKKLNSVLGAIKKKLLITIQDVDRCSAPQKTTEELAALLDKLKGLNNISFVIALGYESGISETIKKVCDYREDLVKVDKYPIFINFIKVLNNRAANLGLIVSNKEIKENDVVISNIESHIKHSIKMHKAANNFNPYDIVSSERSFKHICRRIDSIWLKNKLMGEVDLESLCLLIALREELPLVFANVIKNHMTLFNEIRKLENNEKKEYMQKKLGNKAVDKVETKTVTLNECAQYYPSILNFEVTTSFLDYLFKCNNDLGQGALYKYSLIKHSNYLKRVMSEFVSNTELTDQEALKLFKNIDESGSFEILINNFQNGEKSHHWIEAYTRFYQGYFKPTDKNMYEAIYIMMANFYYKDVVKQNRTSNSLINHTDIQKFMILLLEKCLTTENSKKLFELTLNIPTILMANTHNVESGSCLKLFLSKEQDEELYNIFINKLNVDNEMSKQLYIVDSSHQSLDWIVKQFVPKGPSSFKLFKEIILSSLEKNNKENKSYKFDLWFACYLLDYLHSFDEGNSSSEDNFLEKLKCSSTEIELFKSSLNQLNIDNVGDSYRQLRNPKEIHQRVLSALEKHV